MSKIKLSCFGYLWIGCGREGEKKIYFSRRKKKGWRKILKYYLGVLLMLMCILSTSFAYLFWLGSNKNANILSSVWTTMTELSMLVMICTYVLLIWYVINKCAYLISHLHICFDWLMTISSFVWVGAGSSRLKYYSCACFR